MVPKEKLKKIKMFEELPDEYLDKLAGIISEECFDSGQMIFKEGTAGDALYIINSGCVEIRKITDAAKSTFKTLAIFEKDDYFGEMSLFDDKPRSASASARDSAKILVLKRVDFLKLLQSSPRIAVDQLLGILRVLSDRLRRTSVELTTLYELGRVISSLNEQKAICSSVTEKIYTALEGKGRTWITLWNQFNEEYDLINYEKENIWDKNHPVIMLAQQKKDGWISNNLETGLVRDTAGVPFNIFQKLMVVPIMKSQDGILGFIFTGRRKEEDDFRNADLILLSAVASFTATALINVTFMQEELHRVRLQQGRVSW